MNIKLLIAILFLSSNVNSQVVNSLDENIAFKKIRENTRIDVLLNLLGSGYIGSAAEFLGIGQGINGDFILFNREGLTYGINAMVHNNRRKKDYSLDHSLDQLSTTGSAKIGVVLGKWFPKFHAVIPLSYAVQNVIDFTPDLELKEVQIRGFSTGVIINYPIIFDSRRNSNDWEEICTAKNHVNLHFGIRYDLLSHKEAGGFLMELGIGYRIFNLTRSRLFDTTMI